MSPLSVCTPGATYIRWDTSNNFTLNRHSLSVCMLASRATFVRFVLSGVCHWLLRGHSYYSYHGQDPNGARSMSDLSFLRADAGSICSLWCSITAGIGWKALFFFLSPLDLDEEPTTQQRNLIKQNKYARCPSTPPKITRDQQYGGGGSDRLFTSGYYGNENALLWTSLV